MAEWPVEDDAAVPEPPGFGGLLPHITAPPPGPRSLALAERLQRSEAPAISTLSRGDRPVVWAAAAGANVLDVDGNCYVDTTAAFGVAAAGHRHPAVVAAVRRQAERLLHGMGDFQPVAPRVALAERLAALAPMPDASVLFGLTGSDAVELALKVAAMATGHPGVIAFDAAFHGQSYGALAVTARASFRAPFAAQLGRHVLRAPYPYPYRFNGSAEDCAAASLAAVERLLAGPPPPAGPIGAVLIEPVAGREGEIVPPAGYLIGLREVCDRFGVLLIADEVYTGFGRTGRLFAVEHDAVIPDLLCVGKALGGGLPVSAVLGQRAVMAAWQADTPEAPHSSTFLAHPLGMAAAMAMLDVIREERLVERAAVMGRRLLAGLQELSDRHRGIGQVRGAGMMAAIELVRHRQSKEPAPERIGPVLAAALQRGIILLPGGMHGNVISLGPPLTITEAQLDCALNAIDAALATTGQ